MKMNSNENFAQEIRLVKVLQLALFPIGPSSTWHFPDLVIPPTAGKLISRDIVWEPGPELTVFLP